jgi:hypothetical protein
MHTQLHHTAFIYICFLNIYIIHFIVRHTFYTDSVYESTVQFVNSYYTLQLYVRTFYFPLYGLIMAISTVKHVVVDILYSTCHVEG